MKWLNKFTIYDYLFLIFVLIGVYVIINDIKVSVLLTSLYSITIVVLLMLSEWKHSKKINIENKHRKNN